MTRNVARRCWRDHTRSLPEQTRELAEHIRSLAEGQEVRWHEEEETTALRHCLDRLPDKNVIRATIGVLIFGTALVRLALFTGSGFYAQAGLLPLAFALLPCALIGYLVGSRLHTRMSTQRAVQAVWLLLIVGGASLLGRALAMP